MAEETLASAVAVPEQDTVRHSPEIHTKRRQSSVSEYDSKRRRLSSQANISPQSERRRPSSPPASTREPEERPSRPRGNRDEDRKRGQRLFGGLLGTLSQKPSNAAQRRRADIEKKQQDKLKTQDAQYGELKKRRKEEREEIRRREVPMYEREAYYKPWQPRPGDESVIKEQIEKAEALVAQEVAEFEAKYPPEAFAPKLPTPESQPKPEKPTEQQQPDTQAEESSVQANSADSGPQGQVLSAPDIVSQETNEGASKVQQDEMPAKVDESVLEQHELHNDDGGEVVEDNEDTVIY
ncbi:hypothetical protein N7541_000292 [Penicillium brevicompactum]|uniref:Pinin/SDK/MemA protein domain-containing protein n=1 Tax=Penicillium brevicompactum TaxID=5074 RepID=A0A9W9RUD6_PENBR|nr:hypothetical protein N7541_000292 [Penicillium brevicompactum]